MSFINHHTGAAFGAGYFLVDDENCTRETATIAYNHAAVQTINGRSIVPMGAVIPANGSTAKGILYEDIDVTDGSAPGSIVTEGAVYEDRLPAALDSDAKTAMKGIRVVTSSPVAARPAIFTKFDALTVASAQGASSGKTAITVSGHTMAPGESYVYKTHASTAPACALGTDVSAWTAWDGTSDITATTSHKITVAVKDAFGTAVAAGNATVTSHA